MVFKPLESHLTKYKLKIKGENLNTPLQKKMIPETPPLLITTKHKIALNS